jgi:2'-5' RNA ligase
MARCPAEGQDRWVTDPESMRSHWWWRPGWREGRSFHTWHFTFADNPAALAVAEHYTALVAGLPGVDPVASDWLHLTTQGLGFTDVAAVVTAARRRCAELAPVTVTLGPARMDPEGVFLPVAPVEPLARVRRVLREAIAEVWSPEAVPETAGDYRPHVTLAYSNTTGPAQPVRDALAAYPPRRGEVVVSSVSLIALHRDHPGQYRWSTTAHVALGS